ncbi:hypothetical protein [Streptomyces sp. NRRL S-1022]|uniref:hypothetical protein n=1 Tax=Streptomyces sp. NRRL S-1022 TaxID=1463880 RepID=UPI0004BFD6CE|nr:hypothetical protein [Streptomyces sp. NRRL S-1022]
MAINLHTGEYPIYSFNLSGPFGNKMLMISAPPGDFMNDADMDALMIDFKQRLLVRDDVDSAPLVKYDESHQNL